MKIEYKRIYSVEDCAHRIRLLNQPVSSLVRDIENNFLSLIEVRTDGQVQGWIFCRGVKLHSGELCLIVVHALSYAEGSKLFETMFTFNSFFDWIHSKGFALCEIEADTRDGMKNYLEKRGFKEYTRHYRRATQWEKTIQTQAKQVKLQPQTMTKESQTIPV